MSDADTVTCALLAIALAPFAFWVWTDGYSDRGTNYRARRLVVLAWLAAIAAAVYGIAT